MCASLICRRRATPLLIKTDVSCVSYSTMSVWTCLSSFSPTLPSNSWALGALFLCHTGIGSLPSLSFYWAHVIYYIMQRSSLTGRKMFETMLAVLFSAGRLLYLKLHSTLYWRILYSIGGTGHCTPNGYTSMSTASTTSTWLHLFIYDLAVFTQCMHRFWTVLVVGRLWWLTHTVIMQIRGADMLHPLG